MKFKVTILAIVLIALLSLDSYFTLSETNFGLVFRFGEVVQVKKDPGLHFKLPLIENVSYLDNRILNFNADEKEVIAKDQKRMLVSAFTKYQIIDPKQFYKTVQTEIGIKTRLNSLLDSSLRQVIGSMSLADLLTDKRVEIMGDIKNLFGSELARFGVKVIDVRIMRADLPKENSQAIFSRMKTDREKEAREFRAEGAEQAAIIKSEAEKNKKIIIAEAKKTAEILKGEGDGEAAAIYAKSFQQDPDFFSFLRAMEAYKSSLLGSNTKYLLSPNSDFLKYFDNK